MTQQNVKLVLDTSQFDKGIQKATRSLGGIEKSADRMASGFGNLQKAVIGFAAAFGGIKIAGGFLQTARQLENLKFQLAALTGSTQEASKAMSILSKFAGTVPFQLQDIQLAAPSLLAVAKNTDELNELLAITGDIAAASGLDFQTVALQLQRTFSAGIGAADLFRDRAVKSMLGFQEGVEYNAKQSRDHIINGFREGRFSIAGQSKEMAKTFDGTMSMISDKFFNFQKQLMDSGPFDALRTAAKMLNDYLEKNFGSIEKMAEKMGQAIVQATANVLIMGAKILDYIKPALDFVGKSIANLVNFTMALPPVIRELGIIGFLALGGKGKLIVLTIAGIFDTIRALIGDIIGGLGKMYGGMATIMNKLKLLNDEQYSAAQKAAADMEATMIRMNISFKDLIEIEEGFGETGKVVFEGLGISIDGATENMGEFEKQVRSVLAQMNKLQTQNKQYDDEILRRMRQMKKQGGGTPVSGGNTAEMEKLAKENQKKLEQIKQSLLSEIEAEKAAHQQKLDFLKDYYKGRTQFDTEYRRITEALEAKHQKKMAELSQATVDRTVQAIITGKHKEVDMENMSQEERIKVVAGAGKEVLGVLAQQNKKAFQLQKALAVAQALLDAKSIILSFAKAGSVFGPVGAAIGVAAGIAFTAGQIAAIQAQQYTGRKFGGSVKSGTPYMVGEGGSPELFIPNQSGTIIPNKNLGGGGPVNVTFNIQANDTKGFDELLSSRRGLITGMIRNATESAGQRSVF